MQKPFFRTVFLSFIIFTSCVSRKDIVYFQGPSSQNANLNIESKLVVLQPQDRLTVSVAAPEQDAAIPFNLPIVGLNNDDLTRTLNNVRTLQSYVINSDGNIDFPVLGTIHVAGLTIEKMKELLTKKIADYVKNPIVSIELTNFRISVLGEVNRPNTYLINDQSMSLPKALGLAGDMTIYGLRNNVLVIREESYGDVTRNYIDITDPNAINSPYYYLRQNDIVYIEPNKAQRQGSTFNRNTSVYVSVASFIVSLIVLFTR